MGVLEAVLAWMLLKSPVLAAGFAGGVISAGILPGPLAVLTRLWTRLMCGAAAGTVIAGFGAEWVAAELGKPENVNGCALALGIFGLSFVFKLLKAWNEFDLGGVVGKLVDKITERVAGK